VWWISGLLAVAVILIFVPTIGYGFVNFDDGDYVYENVQVTSGVTGPSLLWALTQSHSANWHPLTWISHMLDVEWWGLWAGGHHLSNVLLHLWSSLLLFWVLWEMTGALWRSAGVAALFAVHPLHVESVAWVAERKDVLSGVFFMLTLGAYLRYVRKPSVWRYGWVALFLALGLMSKPSVVTLPFLLLVLDYWPLGRWPGLRFFWRLGAEKIPLLVLVMISCGLTMWAQQKAVVPFEVYPLGQRWSNVVISYVVYLWQMIAPAQLVVFYPFPRGGWPWLWVAGAGSGLVVLSGTVWWGRKKHPWALVGWLWYLGLLVPMIGLIQVGGQSHADRYTYLSQIGISILVLWTIASGLENQPARSWWRGGLVVVLIVVLGWGARQQVGYWENSEKLWTRAQAGTVNNVTAWLNLGETLYQQKRVDEAMVYGYRALQVQPNNAEVHFKLGVAQEQKANLRQAFYHYRKAMALAPESPKARNNLAWALATQPDAAMRNGAEALALAQQANQLTGGRDPIALDTLAAAYAEMGRFPEAQATVRQALILAAQENNAMLLRDLNERQRLYLANKPYRSLRSD
jgi:Tfp pilus assembly protein PilF